MLSDSEIGSIIRSELDSALSYEGEIASKREMLMDYYNGQPYGDEVEGQSSAVTTEVADTIEWMLPSLLRVFTQGKEVASFTGYTEQANEEAKQKTALSNHVFLQENDGVLILHNMFKDALLQFTGTVKVYWEETESTSNQKYEGLSEVEYQKLLNTKGVTIDKMEMETDEFGIVTYDCKTTQKIEKSGVKYANIPPEEFLISRTARSFDDPVFIGHRSPKTRSQLVEMGFDRDIVDDLPADEHYEFNGQKNARYHDQGNWQDVNTSNHDPNDIVYLGEYYCRIDVNDDGISELYQVFYAGNEVLSKEPVDDHPFAVVVPIPIPHRAIGTCPAEQVADLQFRKSTLVRQMLNNVYQSIFPRVLHSNQVDLDDLLVPRAGGLVGVDTDNPDVAGHAQMIQVTPMLEGILSALEYTDMEKEIRTGVTRNGQGLDANALNNTATGFLGMKDASQQRLDLIARIFANGGVRTLFEKTVDLLSRYQDTVKEIMVTGKPLEINPRMWSSNTACRIDVGIGAGDRQEKIANLNAVLQRQIEFSQAGLVLSDQPKMYNTLSKLITEVGLKDVDLYFNNPEVEESTLFAQNQQMTQMIQQLQAQDPANAMAEAEMAKAQASLESSKMKTALDADQGVRAHQVKMRELDIKEKQAQVDTLKTIADIRNIQATTEGQNIENESVTTGLNDLLKELTNGG